jgi:hypothetical protein
LSAPEQVVGCPLKFLVAGLIRPFAGNKQGIPSGFDTVCSNYFSQPAFHSVPNYSVPNPLACQYSEPALVEPISKETDYQETISRTVAVPVDF